MREKVMNSIRKRFLLSLSILLIPLIFSFMNVTQGSAEECLVPCDEIVSVLPKDQIPAIDSPNFLTISEFESRHSEPYLRDLIVLGVVVDNEARAYPIDILNWHEIVNDEINGHRFSVTYCPLTGSGICYNTTSLDGSTLGTSGRLYENNLVFYDRTSDTYWSQMLGQAIKGKKLGQELPIEPIAETTWNNWKKMYPNSVVLSRETGFTRDYDRNPYPGYYIRNEIWFPTSYNYDLEPYSLYFEKEITLVLKIDNEITLFPFAELTKIPVLNEVLSDQPVIIVFNKASKSVVPFNSTISTQLTNHSVLHFTEVDGSGIDVEKTLSFPVFQDIETGSIWNIYGEAISGLLEGYMLQRIPSYNAYWFAATAFFPKAGIFTGNSIETYTIDLSQSGNSDSYSSPGIPLIILIPMVIGAFFVYKLTTKKTKKN
jgi:hypothetical protein